MIVACAGVVPSSTGNWVSIGTITDSRYLPSVSVYSLGFQRPSGSTITPVAVYITSAGNISVDVPSTGSATASVAFTAIIPI